MWLQRTVKGSRKV